MYDHIQSSMFSARGQLVLAPSTGTQLSMFSGQGPGGTAALPDGTPIPTPYAGILQGTLDLVAKSVPEMRFTRRRYGRQTYTWAYVRDNGGEWLSLGDPWPAINRPREELQRAIAATLALADTDVDNPDDGDQEQEEEDRQAALWMALHYGSESGEE